MSSRSTPPRSAHRSSIGSATPPRPPAARAHANSADFMSDDEELNASSIPEEIQQEQEDFEDEPLKGTFEHPFRCKINPRCPEMNPFGLVIIKVPFYDVGTEQYTVWQVGKFASPLDLNGMSAHVTPEPDTIMLIVDAVSFWLHKDQTLDASINDLKDKTKHPFVTNPTVKNAHLRLHGKREGDLLHQKVHLLVQLPVKYPLDKTIMDPGQTDTEIPKKALPMKKKVQGKEFSGMMTYWEIAEKDGYSTGNAKKGEDLASLIAKMGL